VCATKGSNRLGALPKARRNGKEKDNRSQRQGGVYPASNTRNRAENSSCKTLLDMGLRKKNTTLDLCPCYFSCSVSYMYIFFVVAVDNILEKVKNCPVRNYYNVNPATNPETKFKKTEDKKSKGKSNTIF